MVQFEQPNNVEIFERNFAKYIGAKHAIACVNGTAALHTALLACGVDKKSEVITTAYTFVATSNVILYSGATPLYVDILSDSNPLMDPDLVIKALSLKTKVILPVSLFGKNWMDHMSDRLKNKLEDYSKKIHKIYMVNDASQCIKPGVNDGFNLSTFSFYKSKNFSSLEGGAIVTNDDELAKRCRILIDQGQDGKYNHVMLGYNYRMNDLTAVMINHQVTYHNIGGMSELGRFSPKDGHYPYAVYEHPFMKKLGHYYMWFGHCPKAEELARKVRNGELK